jgi:hypothetical protein
MLNGTRYSTVTSVDPGHTELDLPIRTEPENQMEKSPPDDSKRHNCPGNYMRGSPAAAKQRKRSVTCGISLELLQQFHGLREHGVGGRVEPSDAGTLADPYVTPCADE